MIRSLDKGKGYERRVVKLLTNFFNVPFNRVPMSGGFQKRQDVEDVRFRGDIFTEDEEFNKKYNVLIECKKTQKLLTLLDYIKFLKGEKSVFTDWVNQCKEMIENTNKNFWLIFAWDYGRDFIMIGENKDGRITTEMPWLLEDFLEEENRKKKLDKHGKEDNL